MKNKSKKKSLLDKVLSSIAKGAGDRAGCNDFDAAEARRLIALSKGDEKAFLDAVRGVVAGY